MGRESAVIRWIVILAIVLQLAVPVAALFGPRPSPFGWQMFTAMAPLARVWTEAGDGSLAPVRVEDLLVHPRPEADLGPALVHALCGEADVRAVVIEEGGERTRTPC
jgi:hypothetical protein